MAYQTKMETRSTIQATPEGLKSFLPPLPTRLSAAQQTTVTVRAVHPDGGADVETRFDQFEFHSDLVDRLPEKDRRLAEQAAQDFGKRMVGQTLTAHFDSTGRLVGFEGGEELVRQAEAPLREPLRQVLRFFLGQMNGVSFYPDHPVEAGEEWKGNLSAPPSDQFPFALGGESDLRYAGKARYHGVKAATVDYHFTNAFEPASGGLAPLGPLAPLEAMGVKLDLGVEGQGQGQVLVALDDGRVLQNRSTIRQTFHARLKDPKASPNTEPLYLQIDAQTTLEVDGKP